MQQRHLAKRRLRFEGLEARLTLSAIPAAHVPIAVPGHSVAAVPTLAAALSSTTAGQGGHNCLNFGGSSPESGSRAGCYPSVGVGVRPNGNVTVNVGRSIGVDVSGAHGSVRVGGICIRW